MDLSKINSIIEKSEWSWSHGADSKHPGFSLLYYSLIYSNISNKCVILGSGGGYVPRLIYYAQSELVKNKLLKEIDISLVDVGNGVGGERVYDENGFDDLKELKLYNMKTDDAYHNFNNINYLHVDADHNPSQVYKDLTNYGSRMDGDNWIITAHDCYFSKLDRTVHSEKIYLEVARWCNENNHLHINFNIGRGTTLILPNRGGMAPLDYKEMMSVRAAFFSCSS